MGDGGLQKLVNGGIHAWKYKRIEPNANATLLLQGRRALLRKRPRQHRRIRHAKPGPDFPRQFWGVVGILRIEISRLQSQRVFFRPIHLRFARIQQATRGDRRPENRGGGDEIGLTMFALAERS